MNRFPTLSSLLNNERRNRAAKYPRQPTPGPAPLAVRRYLDSIPESDESDSSSYESATESSELTSSYESLTEEEPSDYDSSTEESSTESSESPAEEEHPPSARNTPTRKEATPEPAPAPPKAEKKAEPKTEAKVTFADPLVTEPPKEEPPVAEEPAAEPAPANSEAE